MSDGRTGGGCSVDEFTGSNLAPPHLPTAFIHRSLTFTYLGTEVFLWLSRTIRPEFKNLIRLQLLVYYPTSTSTS